MRKIYVRIKELIEMRKWRQLALALILITAIVGVAIWVLVWLLDILFTFIALKFDLILMVLAVVGVVLYMWNQKRDEKKKATMQNVQMQVTQAAQISKAAANESLSTVRTCIFQLLQQIPPHLNLVTPATISEINSPTPIIDRKGFFTYQFLAVCSGEINPDMVKSVLQTRLNQMTQAGELPFAEKVYFHNGVMRNILQILTVTSNGSHAVFEVGIAGEALCHWLELQASVKGTQMQPLTGDKRDWDY